MKTYRTVFRIEYVYKEIIGIVIPEIDPNRIYHTKDVLFPAENGIYFKAWVEIDDKKNAVVKEVYATSKLRDLLP